MKSIKLIALGALLTVGAFCTVLYTSCTKDECKGVTCLNTGTCSGGNCVCPSGVTGTTCETIYDASYTNTYVGTGTDNGTPSNTYTNFRLIFAIPTSTTGYSTMTLTIQDNTGASVDVPVMTITLANFTSSGATYIITSTTNAGKTYTGTGTVSATTASVILTETPTTGSATVYTFSNCAKL